MNQEQVVQEEQGGQEVCQVQMHVLQEFALGVGEGDDVSEGQRVATVES